MIKAKLMSHRTTHGAPESRNGMTLGQDSITRQFELKEQSETTLIPTHFPWKNMSPVGYIILDLQGKQLGCHEKGHPTSEVPLSTRRQQSAGCGSEKPDLLLWVVPSRSKRPRHLCLSTDVLGTYRGPGTAVGAGGNEGTTSSALEELTFRAVVCQSC